MKHKSKSKALLKAGQKVRVCQYPNTDFHGFTLQKNHMFGQDEDGYFVVQRIAEKCIYVYRFLTIYSGSVAIGKDWVLQALGFNTDTARQIIEANRTKPGKLEYCNNVPKQVRGFYNPPMITNQNRLPMRNIKIPGGSWGEEASLVAFEKTTRKLYKDITKNKETEDYYTAMEWAKRGHTIEVYRGGKRIAVLSENR